MDINDYFAFVLSIVPFYCAGALTQVSVTAQMNKENWKLQFNHEKCVVCGLCVKACPLQLFNLEIDKYV